MKWLALAAIAGGVCDLLLRYLVPLAHRHGWLDQPGGRRIHRRAVPRLGGVALAAGVAAGAAVAWLWHGSEGSVTPTGPWSLWTGVGVLVLVVTGVLDDGRGLSPRVKLAAQCVAAGCAVAGGVTMSAVSLTVGGTALALPMLTGGLLAAVWLVATTNAVNLSDGVDGLAGTMALVGIASILFMSRFTGGRLPESLIVPLVGALLAFLRWNWHPARIFLGDAGALPLGFVLGLLALQAATDPARVTTPLLAVAALAYPLIDTVIAIGRRWLRGHSTMAGDRQHLHHRVLERGLPSGRGVLLIALVAMCTAVAGMALALSPPRWTVAIWTVGAVLLAWLALVAAQWLHLDEVTVPLRSAWSVARHARLVIGETLRVQDCCSGIRVAATAHDVFAHLARLPDETGLEVVELRRRSGAWDLAGTTGERGELVARWPAVADGDPASRAWIEYPCGGGALAPAALVLRVGWRPAGPSRHPRAERVATRVAVALREWVGMHGELPLAGPPRPGTSLLPHGFTVD